MSIGATFLMICFIAGVFGKSHPQKLDRLASATLRKHQSHDGSAATERLNLDRERSGSGITNVLHMWEWVVLDQLRYLGGSPDERLKGVAKFHRNNGGLHFLEDQADMVLTKYDKTRAELMAVRTKTIEREAAGPLPGLLGGKKFHGVHEATLEDGDIDRGSSHRWLTTGSLNPPIEAQVVQDSTCRKAWYRAEIIKEKVSPICAACGKEK